MDLQQFLEELKDIDFTSLDREQQEEFRTILLDYGLFDECLELSKVITNKTEKMIQLSKGMFTIYYI